MRDLWKTTDDSILFKVVLSTIYLFVVIFTIKSVIKTDNYLTLFLERCRRVGGVGSASSI